MADRRPSRLASRILIGGLPVAVLFGMLPGPQALASTSGNASINLSKTVGTSKVSPALSVGLGADRSNVIPGDIITYTATVTNSGGVLTIPGTFKAQNNGDVKATVAAYWDEIEYFSSSQEKWIPLGGFAAHRPGYAFAVPPPIQTGMTLTATPVPSTGVIYPESGDRILGTAIPTRSTASWGYSAFLSLTAAQAATLTGTSKRGIRNVVHFEVTPRPTSLGQPFTYRVEFTNPLPTTSTAATNVVIMVTLPSGSSVQITSAQVPGLASIPSGGSVVATTKHTVAVVPAKGPSETDSAYLTRLTSVEGSELKATASATGNGASGPISSPTSSPVSTIEHVPIGSLTKSGPPSAQAGATVSYDLALANTGGAMAGPLTVADSLPDGTTGTITGVPGSMAPGASATAQSSIVIPVTQSPGPLTDTATLDWNDANENAYGPVSSVFTTEVSASGLPGWLLLLAPQVAGPNVTGTKQTITATLTDDQRSPVPDRQLDFAVTGANAVAGSATTDARGVATFTYTGASDGTDIVHASLVDDDVASNGSMISWSTPANVVAMTPVKGTFFAEDPNQTAFVAKPGDEAAFTQVFPTIEFNPSAGTIPNDASGVDPTTRPFTDLTLDVAGNYTGTIVAQGKGQQAGVGDLYSFDAVFTGNFIVAAPGDVTFHLIADDGFLLGIGGEASRVSGPYEDAPPSNSSPFKSYPLVAAFNTAGATGAVTYPVTVHFFSAGTYPYELDYFERSPVPSLSGYVATGAFYTCALTTSGGAKCWGDNTGGQLGDGTQFITRTAPVDVIGLTSGVTAIDAAGSTTCALTTQGGVKCWGQGDHGELGNGKTNSSTTPVNVSGLTSGVAAIASGNIHNCALTVGGGVKCWGYNNEGELGDGSTTTTSTPVDVVGLSSGVVAIAAGNAHTCALTEAGGVKCWGYNNTGQLGDGTRTIRTVPVDVFGLTSGVALITGGREHSCAVTTLGAVKCWGFNAFGQLGNGSASANPELTPVDVVELGPVDAISAGSYWTCAVTTAGGAKCWGRNGRGQLGEGTTTERDSPVDVSGLTSGVVDIAAASYPGADGHTCALTDAETVKCWGQNAQGQLGDGTMIDRLTPVAVSGSYGPLDGTPRPDPRITTTDLSLAMSVASFTPSTDALSFYVGYADGLRPGGSIFPFPWRGSSAVTNFVGQPEEIPFDAGALRFDNNSHDPITLDGVTVDIGPYHYDIWGSNITVDPHSVTILTQTTYEPENFDTSDATPDRFGCVPTGYIPQIHVTQGGVTTTYEDTAQLLNTKGIDPPACGGGNESTPWTRIGGASTRIDTPLPPAVSLALTPLTVDGDIVGQTQRFTCTAMDPSGRTVAGLPINVVVYGPNARTLAGTTDSEGRVSVSYTADNIGTDIVSASAFIAGLRALSNQVVVPWASPPQPTSSGTDPPTIADLLPENGAVIAHPVDVTATITAAPGDSIASYSVTLEPVEGGTPQTIASGTGQPPVILGILDPSLLIAGTYAFTVTATEDSGGSASLTNLVNLTPVLPAPPPVNSGTDPPTISDVTPQNGTAIASRTAVNATVTPAVGDSIASYLVTLEPAEGGSSSTIVSGAGVPPSPLGTLDPIGLAGGVYALAISVTADSGSGSTHTVYVSIVTSIGPASESAPSIIAQPSQETYQRGQPVSISVTVTNNSSLACELSDFADAALEIKSLRLDGEPVTPDAGAILFGPEVGTADSGDSPVGLWSLASAEPGESITVTLDSVNNPPDSSSEEPALRIIDLPTNDVQYWPISIAGAYQVTLQYDMAGLPSDGVQVCAGTSDGVTTNFTIVNEGQRAPRKEAPQQAGVPNGWTVSPTVMSEFLICQGIYTSTTFGDIDAVYGHLVSRTGASGWKLQIDSVLSPDDPLDHDRSSTNPDFHTLKIRIFWNSNPTGGYYNGPVSKNGLPREACENLYHEMKHADDLIFFGDIRGFECIDRDGTDWGLTYLEVSATFSQNDFRAVKLMGALAWYDRGKPLPPWGFQYLATKWCIPPGEGP